MVGLVDQGSWGGGGKIWQRGRPSGGGGSRGGGGGSGGGVGSGGGGGGVDGSGGLSTMTAEDQGQPLVGLLVGLGGDDRSL